MYCKSDSTNITVVKPSISRNSFLEKYPITEIREYFEHLDTTVLPNRLIARVKMFNFHDTK